MRSQCHENLAALEWAGQRLGEAPLPRLVWRCLEDAVDTLRRMPDREQAYLLSGDHISWPTVVHTAQERYEAEVQRLADAKMSKEEPPLRWLPISDPTAIPRMLTVLGWLRYVRVRRGSPQSRVKRDQVIVLAMAQGWSAARVQKKYLPHLTESAAKMVKQKVVNQIAGTLSSQLTLTETTSKCVNLTT